MNCKILSAVLFIMIIIAVIMFIGAITRLIILIRIEKIRNKQSIEEKKIENNNPMKYKTGTFKNGLCTIIITIDAGLWHLSISTPTESPTYSQIKEARYKFLPDNLYMGQIFPPKAEFVNLHPFCHHLWELKK